MASVLAIFNAGEGLVGENVLLSMEGRVFGDLTKDGEAGSVEERVPERRSRQFDMDSSRFLGRGVVVGEVSVWWPNALTLTCCTSGLCGTVIAISCLARARGGALGVRKAMMRCSSSKRAFSFMYGFGCTENIRNSRWNALRYGKSGLSASLLTDFRALRAV